MFIAVFAWINLIILLRSNEFLGKCNMAQNMSMRLTIVFSYYLHYIVTAFGLFGFLFRSPVILILYLIVPIVIFAQWKIRDSGDLTSSCVLTNFTDLACHIDARKDTVKFITIFDRLGIQDITVSGIRVPLAYSILIPLGFAIAIAKLVRMYMSRK